MDRIHLRSFLHIALLCAAISLSWGGTDYAPEKKSYVVTGDVYPPTDMYSLVSFFSALILIIVCGFCYRFRVE